MKFQYTEKEISEAAKLVLRQAKNSKVIAFYGDMGAGKTTLIKAIIKELGAIDSGSSPTFGLVNEYLNKDGDIFAFHFDCYRLNNETEALDLGIEEYLYDNKWVFIEWPKHISSILPTDTLHFNVHFVDKNIRFIETVNS
ncbi:tRNA (adenosine(37)-N6)-threonylcarbamoyltransferase complex ATPase subunit type 1 TsaE [Croceivirga lutea]|uniref:tRNA (adenosine(37)-N6)-threonylcarbamoyltransferase complex ATPase subunit type 1 TsaE n=1 Tax=Croceivirga lutea TaxID=1775167 RepID=UPI001639FECE|nr:tRNA (adenosine(37)-N6)-threonylcarbamoyltransferase complex ATPase subunit type 1 TsaE [Croceivirga lutea]GGG44517.1 tRNA (adenosine(37)-N6)-threonylcarbamoyltransferase complex ATPase subunit type 1 TsaE [Croceivirga lutea]